MTSYLQRLGSAGLRALGVKSARVGMRRTLVGDPRFAGGVAPPSDEPPSARSAPDLSADPQLIQEAIGAVDTGAAPSQDVVQLLQQQLKAMQEQQARILARFEAEEKEEKEEEAEPPAGRQRKRGGEQQEGGPAKKSRKK